MGTARFFHLNTMVGVEKYCRGFSLRTGCIILFWLEWLVCVIMSVRCSQILFKEPFPQTKLNVPASCIVYFFIYNIIGAISFSQALHGLIMNSPIYLNCSYYYFYYSLISNIALVILLLVDPDKFVPYVQEFSMFNYGQIFWMIAMLFNAVLNMYFATVVKRFRDSMTEVDNISI